MAIVVFACGFWAAKAVRRKEDENNVASSQCVGQDYEAVERKLTAMGAETFEVGALQRGDGDQPQFMLLRTWDQKKVIESIPWLLISELARWPYLCAAERGEQSDLDRRSESRGGGARMRRRDSSRRR